MFYIQMKYDNQLDTIDKFDTRKEAREILKEYNVANPFAFHYISTRACKHWHDNIKERI